MNFVELQDKIRAHPEKIIDVIEHLGYRNIRDKNTYYNANNPDGDAIALVVYKESLRYVNYTRNHEGSLISLVQHDKNCSFSQALNYIAKWTGIKTNNIQIKPPFGGFYKTLISEQNGNIQELPPYDWQRLPEAGSYSKMWIEQGVSLWTQKEFGIRYDHETNGIIIPECSIDGSLVGAKWRNCDPNCEMNERWNMYLRFNQSHNLYGLNRNYEEISKKHKVIIFEAEKSTLHLYDWGCCLGCSVNGHHISETQKKILQSLMCDEITIAFDKDICEEEVRFESKKLLLDNPVCKNRVSYIYDSNNLLGIDTKNSPTDCGKEIFNQLYKERKKVS